MLIWTIVILSLLLLLSMWYNFYFFINCKYLLDYWAENENKKWLDAIKKSGSEMINLSKIK